MPKETNSTKKKPGVKNVRAILNTTDLALTTGMVMITQPMLNVMIELPDGTYIPARSMSMRGKTQFVISTIPTNKEEPTL